MMLCYPLIVSAQLIQNHFQESAFMNPAKTYRLQAFWSWNDKLEDQELRKQIKAMDDGGWGGFYMHARGGLLTKYFSDDWFNCARICIDEAHKRGMEAWMYDENGWPSGTANRTISFMDKAYRETHLFSAKDSIPHNKEDITIYKQEKIRNEEGKEETYYFYKWKGPLGQARWAGGSYVDLMNPDATAQFIRLTHERYKREIGTHFGTTVPGIFTDDLNIIWDLYGLKKLAVPWTDRMPEIFSEMHGYSIIDNVDKLFLPLPGYEKVRVDFYRTVNKLFSENYWKMLYDWCEDNKLRLTGHHMGDGLFFMDLMQNFQYKQTPGLDILSFRQSHLLSLRAITSVSHQLGKERTNCEAFAACGHNLSFEDQKWLSNWLFVNGVNTITAHIFQYSMRGSRKRDHPPAMSYQQPWWRHNTLMSDYQARCSYLLTRGKRACDILLLYPTETFSMTYTPYWIGDAEQLNDKFNGAIKTLQSNQLDFDLGSEELISKYGLVNNHHFEIGRAGYSLVVLPPARTIRQSTFNLLTRYINNDGLIFAIDELPSYIDGTPMNKQQQEVMAKIPVISQDLLAERLTAAFEPEVKMKSANLKKTDKIIYSQRNDGANSLYYFINNDREDSYTTEISLKGIGKPYELDLSTGQKTPIHYWTEQGRTVFNHSFAPVGALALMVDHLVSETVTKVDINKVSNKVSRIETASWVSELTDPNALTLDYCRYSTDGIQYSEPVYILDMSERMRSNPNIRHIRYSFQSTTRIPGEAFFILETPQLFEIKMNNRPVSSEGEEFYIDTYFKKINISGLIQKGENHIDLQIVSKNELAIENVYVFGNFGIDYVTESSFRMTPLRKKVHAGDLTKQGFTFFAGSTDITNTFNVDKILPDETYLLKLDSLHATVAEVYINGQKAGSLTWKPYVLDVTPYLKKGKNDIRISLTNSLHNLMGYHHTSQRQRNHFVTGDFFNDKENWTDDYFIFPFGISSVTIEGERTN